MIFGLTPEATMVASLASPLVGALLIALSYKTPNLREAVTLLTSAITFALVASLYPLVLDGATPTVQLGEMLPGLEFLLVLEPLGMLFALIASFLWIITSIYAIGYMRGHHEKNQTRFYLFFAIAIAATLGIAFAGNMLTLFVFYELLTLTTFPLVTHAGTPEAKRAGRVYLGILIGTSIGFQLIAIIWTWSLTGTLNFQAGGIMEGKISQSIGSVLLLLYIFGVGKAALMPFHRWLPAAMVAPTPVSALLHAVAVVKAGVFTILKIIVYLFGVDYLTVLINPDWLFYVAGFTILAASIIALRQDNLKRRLAYSTISQLSYVIMAAAILAPLSLIGAALHIAAHAFGKITLFFAAGSIYVKAHKTEISQLDGIGRRMPWTMAAFAIGALSMIGVPPTAGFVSKWYILGGAVETHHIAAIGVIFLSTLLNAGYFLPIIYRAFFKKVSDNSKDHGEAPWPVVVALTLTAAMTVLMFFFPGLFLELARQMMA